MTITDNFQEDLHSNLLVSGRVSAQFYRSKQILVVTIDGGNLKSWEEAVKQLKDRFPFCETVRQIKSIVKKAREQIELDTIEILP